MATESEQNEAQPSHSSGKAAEVAAFAAGGGVAGAAASTLVGNMGLAVAGTAISVGLLPVVAIGAIAGLAVYGVKQAFFSDDDNAPVVQPTDTNQSSDGTS
jgi:uncharacterized membrane protein YebE (DUF533 family)